MLKEKSLAQHCGYYDVDYSDSQLSYEETEELKEKREAEMKAELSKRVHRVGSCWM